ncbi:MAG TPA: zinc-binding dehydrogenase [Acidimicrobiales bacterium]|jgi:threonine dehydrogenase-like Zn-dependent dehydrogenase|nr:zinc-binding dehydrogenase [Acidimicrobiales bacterium]
MKALVFERKMAKFAAAAVAGRIAPGRGAQVGPLSLQDIDEPELPGPGWVRVRPRLAGICGSDLATIDGHSSRYFEPIVSFPFVPGHEVVGELDDGRRVALVPILTCVTRDLPLCRWCGAGQPNLCEHTAFGHLEPGLQTGFCESTGGGWSIAFVAHESQLVAVPDDLSDDDAVMIEPTACAINAIEMARPGDTAIIGAGTIGILTLAAARLNRGLTNIVVAAKHPAQVALARKLGADRVVSPGELAATIRSRTHSMVVGDRLTGGCDNVIDCIGSEASLAQALSVVAPRGNVLLVGMPGSSTHLDLTPLWHRQTSLRGAYAYTPAHFQTAINLVRALRLGRLVSATYPLSRYREAIEHAANAGARGAVKIAFDLRSEKGR